MVGSYAFKFKGNPILKAITIFHNSLNSGNRLHTSRRMPSSGLLRRLALLTDVLEERSTSIIRVSRIDELRTTLAETNN
jgi:hypothetical protein